VYVNVFFKAKIIVRLEFKSKTTNTLALQRYYFCFG
jgi:hypothetical protein